MNSSLFKISRRAFSYNYSNPSNSKVFLQVSAGETSLGKMVFELYDSHQGATTENFKAFVSAENGFVGSKFHRGTSGLGLEGGNLSEDNSGAFGWKNCDGDLSLQHHKRGMLTTVTDGSNSNGSKFMITFGEAPFLDGYQTVFGELVEGDDVLQAVEAQCSRQGDLKTDISVTAAGEL